MKKFPFQVLLFPLLLGMKLRAVKIFGKIIIIDGNVIIKIKEIIQIIDSEALPEVKLKELVGHTPLQVLFGGLLGVAMAFLCQYWLFPLIFPTA